MLCINSNLHNFQKDFELIKDHKFIDISVGHHPNSTGEIESSEIPKFIEQYINDYDNRIDGIGETGIDDDYQVPRIKQKKCLELH